MKIFLISALIAVLLFVGIGGYIYAKSFFIGAKKAKIRKRDSAIRDYLKNFDSNDHLAIIDETPREVYVGDRFYLLKPLKYRQYTRLCVLFARTLQKMQDKGIEYALGNKFIGDITEVAEDDFFRAIAMVLYFSGNGEEDDEATIFAGVQREFEYVRKHSTLEQISRVIEVILVQNDIQRALKAFGLAGKKKAQET